MRKTPRTQYKSNLGDLFIDVKKNHEIFCLVDQIFHKESPLTILLEGSADVKNIEILVDVIKFRKNPKDIIVLIDINSQSIKEHKQHIINKRLVSSCQAMVADMNDLPFDDHSIDLVINYFTVNFNTSDRDDDQTIAEIQRVLKPGMSACLFSVYVSDESNKVADRGYAHGARKKDTTFTFPAVYYQSAFKKYYLKCVNFALQNGTDQQYLSYRRFLLMLQSPSPQNI
ncbi:MAG: class I SAM-dependent methyltransferase [Candidatus Gottesmanbacteria bacterium]